MVTAITTFVVSVALVRLTLAGAGRIGAIVDPSHDRWGDRRVPKIGGLGIVGAIAIGCGVAAGWDLSRLAVVVAALAASALGLADDLGSVSPRRRVIFEAAIGLSLGAIVGRNLGPGVIPLALVGLVGVVASANLTNLVDNADGLAASLTAVSSLTIAEIGLAAGSPDASLVVAVAVVGATLGFLVWNHPPARLFMGDCGSLMLGTALAGAGLIVLDEAASRESGALLVIVAMPIALVMQAGDVALVVVSRVRRGTSPERGGVDHTSHRLLRAGLGPWQMLAAIVTPAALAGVAIVGAVRTGEPRVVVLVATATVALVMVGEAILARVVPFPYAPLPAAPLVIPPAPDPAPGDPLNDPIGGVGGHVRGPS